MKPFLIPVLVICALLLPSFAKAKTPEPVTHAYEALEDISYTNKTNMVMSMSLFDDTIETDMKLTAYVDKNGNVDGQTTVSMDEPETGKLKFKMEYRYFENDDAFYFRVTGLPKEVPPNLDGLRSKTWYVGTLDEEALEKAMGESPFLDSEEMGDGPLYTQLRYTEKGSTKKEYRYTYVGEVNLLGKISGTLTINKQTLLPTKHTLQIGSKGHFMSLKSTSTYTYGGKSAVKRPTGAIMDQGFAEELFSGM